MQNLDLIWSDFSGIAPRTCRANVSFPLHRDRLAALELRLTVDPTETFVWIDTTAVMWFCPERADRC